MIYVDKKSKVPLYLQVYDQIKTSIVDGIMRKGAKLPATRTLASQLSVSRNTVESAYQLLVTENYITGRIGSGFTVSDIDNKIFVKKQGEGQPGPVGNHGAAVEPNKDVITIDFNFSNIDNDLFPYNKWKNCYMKVLNSVKSLKLTTYNETQGELILRKELKTYLHRLRGIDCDLSQIVVCCGFTFSVEKIFKLLPRSVNTIAIENPGSDLARTTFSKLGLNFEYVNVFPKNTNFVEDVRRTNADVVYITPSHQCPLGTTMPVEMRHELLEWAYERGAYILEDDYDYEFNYNTNPVPSLQSLDKHERVIYVGSFSKVFSPSLRTNYLVMPDHLIETYYEVYRGVQAASPWLQQETLALFMQEGQLERHIRKSFKIYKERRDLVVKLISSMFGKKIEVIGSKNGTYFILRVKIGMTQDELIERARKKGVRIYSTYQFWANRDEAPSDAVLIGFGMLDSDNITKGFLLLKEAWLG
ncbi:MAG: PLP-dependent aminotransferase family protein [Deltaproteobacteria bacterium]|jgi:GntR family transcriptional regulator/MocR family aminotransferase|nr:PLP-dependent aminotransferase family protein [Deltaproteobacteria bacterium]